MFISQVYLGELLMKYYEELQKIQERCNNEYGEVTYEEAMQHKFPFGKYQGMLLIDLLEYDPGYFSYMKQQILNDTVSSSLKTYYQKIDLLFCMNYVSDQLKIKKWSEEYEQRHKC
jgi:hypothetical protein